MKVRIIILLVFSWCFWQCNSSESQLKSEPKKEIPEKREAFKSKIIQKQIDDYLQKGEDLINEGDANKAVREFLNVLEIEPNNIKALLKLSFIGTQIKQDLRSVKYANQVLQLDPNNIVALYYRGVAQNNQQDYVNAEIDFNTILKKDPNHYETLLDRGAVRIQLNKLDLAIADLEKAIGIYPHNVKNYINLGLAYKQQYQWQKAIDAYNKGLEIGEAEGYLLALRYECFLGINDTAKACKDLQKAISLGYENLKNKLTKYCN